MRDDVVFPVLPVNIPVWAWALASVLAVAGAVLLVIVWRNRQGIGAIGPRCPSCGYSLVGLGRLKCPECGTSAKSERDTHWRVRHPARWTLLAIGLALPLMVCLTQVFGLDAYYGLMPKWTKKIDQNIGGTRVVIERRRDPRERETRAKLLHRGSLVFSCTDADIEFGNREYDPKTDQILIAGAGEDLNLDGVSEVVLTAYSGGAHCCYTVNIFECPPNGPPRHVAHIPAQNGMGFKRLSTGETIVDITDQTFDYWNAPHSDSPFHSVWYRLRAGRLEVALDQMPSPSLMSDPELASIAGAVASDLAAAPLRLNPQLWGTVQELAYADDSRLDSFFRAAWPEQQVVARDANPFASKGDPPIIDREVFRQSILAVLNASPGLQDVRNARAAKRAGAENPKAVVGDPANMPIEGD